MGKRNGKHCVSQWGVFSFRKDIFILEKVKTRNTPGVFPAEGKNTLPCFRKERILRMIHSFLNSFTMEAVCYRIVIFEEQREREREIEQKRGIYHSVFNS